MLSVGILAHDSDWAQSLNQSAPDSEFHISGWLTPGGEEARDMKELIDHSDLIWIPEKINGHMDEAVQVIRKSKHLLLGFPVSDFIDDALPLLKLAQEAHIQVQVGHHDRYQPAIRSCLPYIHQPQTVYLNHHLDFITDPEQPLKLMKELVSDLDLLLPLISNPIRKIRTHPSYNLHQIPVVVDVNIEFHNGTLIALHYTSTPPVSNRIITILQSDRIIEIDLSQGISRQRNMAETLGGDYGNWDPIWPPIIPNGKTIPPQDGAPDRLVQCLSFIHALNQGKVPVSPLEDGFMALEAARLIYSQICR